jgi:hypothetical protein
VEKTDKVNTEHIFEALFKGLAPMMKRLEINEVEAT